MSAYQTQLFSMFKATKPFIQPVYLPLFEYAMHHYKSFANAKYTDAHIGLKNMFVHLRSNYWNMYLIMDCLTHFVEPNPITIHFFQMYHQIAQETEMFEREMQPLEKTALSIVETHRIK